MKHKAVETNNKMTRSIKCSYPRKSRKRMSKTRKIMMMTVKECKKMKKGMRKNNKRNNLSMKSPPLNQFRLRVDVSLVTAIADDYFICY